MHIGVVAIEQNPDLWDPSRPAAQAALAKRRDAILTQLHPGMTDL